MVPFRGVPCPKLWGINEWQIFNLWNLPFIYPHNLGPRHTTGSMINNRYIWNKIPNFQTTLVCWYIYILDQTSSNYNIWKWNKIKILTILIQNLCLRHIWSFSATASPSRGGISKLLFFIKTDFFLYNHQDIYINWSIPTKIYKFDDIWHMAYGIHSYSFSNPSQAELKKSKVVYIFYGKKTCCPPFCKCRQLYVFIFLNFCQKYTTWFF